jgi:phage gpG-like protein
MTPEEFKKRLSDMKKGFKEFYDAAGPAIAGNTAVRLFKENFQTESFFGRKWQDVKRRQNDRNFKTLKRGKNKGQKRAVNAAGQRKILTGETGDLGRSIQVKEAADGHAVIWANPSAFGSKQPYGAVHNEGLRAGRGAGFRMPKRQFIGDHPQLRKAIADELDRKINEILNK